MMHNSMMMISNLSGAGVELDRINAEATIQLSSTYFSKSFQWGGVVGTLGELCNNTKKVYPITLMYST